MCKMNIFTAWRQTIRDELLPDRTGSRLNWLAVAAIALTLMGLFRSVAFFFVGGKAFVGGGHWVMTFSPIPTVIHGLPAPADFVKWVRVEGFTADYVRFEKKGGMEMYAWTGSSQFTDMAYADALVDPTRQRSLEILADGYCENGELARKLQLHAPVREITIETPRQTDFGPDPVRIQIKCM